MDVAIRLVDGQGKHVKDIRFAVHDSGEIPKVGDDVVFVDIYTIINRAITFFDTDVTQNGFANKYGWSITAQLKI